MLARRPLTSAPAARPRLVEGGEWPGRWGVLWPAVPLFLVCLGGTIGAGHNQDTAPSGWAFVLAGTAGLTLLLRRRAPWVGVSAAALATGAYLLLGQPYGPILFVGPIWAWCLAAAYPVRRVLPWLAGYLAVFVATGAPVAQAEGGIPAVVVATAGFALALAAGTATGSALSARTRSDAAARAEAARRAVSEERLAMAQDVHDGVGHSLAVIALQAGVAAHVLDRDPARARELLASVVATSREALDGLRADLDRLRDPAGAAARAPDPGLADLPQLLDRMRDGGLALRVTLEPGGPVPPAVGAVAYRIVQESLTNVLRHAGSAEASVSVRRDGGLVVEVADSGRGAGDTAGGTGIAGMRRRAGSVGGTLAAGPRADGGFLVRAELPA